MNKAPHSRGRLLLRAFAFTCVLAALGSFASGAPAAGSGPYSLDAGALLSASRTDLALRVGGPDLPPHLDKVHVKAWHGDGNGVMTRNFFDVPAPNGVATLALDGPNRGDRLEVSAHLKNGQQYNLEAETIVLRRPDLTVERIDTPDDVVRTRPFAVTVTVGETGGDVGAHAQLALFDGASTTPLAVSPVDVGAGSTSAVTLRIVLAKPLEHRLRAVVSGSVPAEWDVEPNAREKDLYVNHYGENGVVATDHFLATQIGSDVLQDGGNAFDAAAAVQFALGVVQPHLNGLGGGSNAIVRIGETGEVFAIDAREKAPAATTPTTYAGAVGLVRPNGFAVGVPGTVRAVDYMLSRWGTRSLAQSVKPAIGLAEDGFAIGQYLATQIPAQQGVFQPETRAIFLNPDGSAPAQGAKLKQVDLAKTLRLLARDGASAFYEGEIAPAIVEATRRAAVAGREGKMTLADLRDYSIDVAQPASLRYRGFDVFAPQPGGSSGGVVLLESLGLMREFLADPRNTGYPWGYQTRNSLHVFIEAMRLAFADRDFWVGDSAYTDVPTSGLLDPGYLRARSALIAGGTTMCNLPNISPPTVAPGNPRPYVGLADTGEEPQSPTPGHTSHFSIIDRWGNAVVMTSTIRTSFGTGITVPGYGILLNDSLGLFNQVPKANAALGNPGANDAAGGKRPMGNMTPTLILKNGEPFAGTGTLGSGFIPSVVLNVVLNLIEYDLPLQQAVDAPRIWIQLPSGAAQLNIGLDQLIPSVRAMGHLSPMNGGCAGDLNRIALPPFTPGAQFTPNVGSTGSFGVDLADFGLLGGVDATRLAEAATVVVERS
jgi:gamma-glutamyltranspeptidase / glutathione hydrolase